MLLLALVTLTYQIPSTVTRYDVSVAFDGYLPVLGGREGKAEVVMGVDLCGLSNDRASSEITDLKIVLNKAVLPFTPKSIQTFFPKTTITYAPNGKILKSDAPNVKLPVRLPGLDAKRFPDISYLPIEFPEGDLQEGKSFTFKKEFDGSDMLYTVTPTAINDQKVELAIKVEQSYVLYEDARHNQIPNDTDAAFRISTDVSGEGKATFLRSKGMFEKVSLKALSLGHVMEISTKKQSDRKLETVITVLLGKK